VVHSVFVNECHNFLEHPTLPNHGVTGKFPVRSATASVSALTFLSNRTMEEGSFMPGGVTGFVHEKVPAVPIPQLLLLLCSGLAGWRALPPPEG
jgi:hypothetical protein